MRWNAIIVLVGLSLLPIAGCLSQYGTADCDTLYGRHARMCQEYQQRKADAQIRQETAKLLKAYRECLQKYESQPEKAKEICAIYTQALHQIEIKQVK